MSALRIANHTRSGGRKVRLNSSDVAKVVTLLETTLIFVIASIPSHRAETCKRREIAGLRAFAAGQQQRSEKRQEDMGGSSNPRSI